jgi:hypothetical protein
MANRSIARIFQLSAECIRDPCQKPRLLTEHELSEFILICGPRSNGMTTGNRRFNVVEAVQYCFLGDATGDYPNYN